MASEAQTGVSLHTHGGEVGFVLLRRFDSHAEMDWDRDAIFARVFARNDGLSGSFGTLMCGHNLRIDFALDILGQIRVQAEVRPSAERTDRLLLAFVADQTYLPEWIEQLDVALRNFPPQV